ncbi:MAG: plastocyanin/azurin family copper-binding protein [Candidatus Saccharibacteria bacterium]
MKAFNPIKNGISLLLTVLLLVDGCNSHAGYTPQNHVVEIKDMKFQPAELKLNQGDIVTWINRDIVSHDVTEENKTWASPALSTDATWKKVITQSGTYYCSIHVMMKGTLTVK